MVIEADPIPNDTACVLQDLKPLAINALILESSDDPLDHVVMYADIGRDELLVQAVAFEQGRVASADEDQSVVQSQKERRLEKAGMAVSSNQSLLQCRFSSL